MKPVLMIQIFEKDTCKPVCQFQYSETPSKFMLVRSDFDGDTFRINRHTAVGNRAIATGDIRASMGYFSVFWLWNNVGLNINDKTYHDKEECQKDYIVVENFLYEPIQRYQVLGYKGIKKSADVVLD